MGTEVVLIWVLMTKATDTATTHLPRHRVCTLRYRATRPHAVSFLSASTTCARAPDASDNEHFKAKGRPPYLGIITVMLPYTVLGLSSNTATQTCPADNIGTRPSCIINFSRPVQADDGDDQGRITCTTSRSPPALAQANY